jgi:FeS assembly SUF system protein
MSRDVDPEYEKLKTRRLLPVLQHEVEPTAAFILEGAGKQPEPVEPETLRAALVDALKTVHDPEIPLNIYDLGLIYGIELDDSGDVHVTMTLTAPGCPVAGSLVQEVHDKVLSTPGVRHAKTELVWDPPWTRERLSLAAQLELGLL